MTKLRSLNSSLRHLSLTAVTDGLAKLEKQDRRDLEDRAARYKAMQSMVSEGGDLHEKSEAKISEGRKVAVLILTYNSASFLEDCLNSLEGQTFKNFETLVIDNGSTDGSPEVAERFPWVKILRNRGNLGFARGMNVGLRECLHDFEYLVLLNPDARVDSRWLSELVRVMEADNEIGVCTSLVFSYDGREVAHAGGCVLNLLLGIMGGYRPNEKQLLDKKVYKVFYASGSSIIIRSKLLREVGLFDPMYFGYYEDVDLCWRSWLRGYKVVCNPKSIAFHYESGSILSLQDFLLTESHKEKNIVATYYSNLGRASIFLLALPFLVFRPLFNIWFSLVFLRVSSRILFARLQGVKEFFRNIRYYSEKRRRVQVLRRKSDTEVFRENPGSLIKIRYFLRPIPSVLAVGHRQLMYKKWIR